MSNGGFLVEFRGQYLINKQNMQDNGFWDFAIFYELMFPDDEDRKIECEHCGRVIKGNEKVGWIDKEKGIFKCPNCGEELKLD